jgi:hypothetical protein
MTGGTIRHGTLQELAGAVQAPALYAPDARCSCRITGLGRPGSSTAGLKGYFFFEAKPFHTPSEWVPSPFGILIGVPGVGAALLGVTYLVP